MEKDRVEAFSDGVLAVIITIMVLELKAPAAGALSDLAPLWPTLLSYILSFIYIAIYWNNHHHLFKAVQHVDGAAMWANLHLLFWLSLTPFMASWAGQNKFASAPVAIYGVGLLFSGVAYYILAQTLMRSHGANSALARAIGSDRKGKASIVFYGVGVAAAFWQPLLSCALYVLVAIIWLVPDRRIERALEKRKD